MRLVTARALSVREERWPIAGSFRIARGSKSEARVVVVELRERDAVGRGECVPYPRYGESVASVLEQIESLRLELERGLSRGHLQSALPTGAARNAVDCALWDLEAKLCGKPVWALADLPEPRPLLCAVTISLDTPEAMAAAASRCADHPLLKLKLGDDADLKRVRDVRSAVPRAGLIVDANEAWSAEKLRELAPALAELGVELIEQPLPAGHDGALAGFRSPVPLCADESVHDRASLTDLSSAYSLVNIKLDKAGGLSEALATLRVARDAGLEIMVGCMVGTSLAMAPAALLGASARFVDLDGPLLLARDRVPGISYRAGVMEPPPSELWG